MFPGSNEKRRASSPIRGSVNAPTLNSPPRRFSSPHHPPTIAPIHYSDRYIPSRTGSSLENSFDLMTRTSISNTPQNTVQSSASGSENDSTRIRNSLIRAELLGQGGTRGNKRGGEGVGGSPNVLRWEKSVTTTVTVTATVITVIVTVPVFQACCHIANRAADVLNIICDCSQVSLF